MDTDNVNPQDGQEKDNTPLIDKVLQNNPFVKMGSATVENVQTQSMVKSSREEADDKLAAINAYNADIARRQKLADDASKAKRTVIYIILGIFFAGIFAALIWLAINAITAMTKPVEISEDQNQPGGIEEETKEKCTPDTCESLSKVSSTLTLLRGKSKIYLYDSTTKKATLTNIPEQDYHAITPFVWGKDTFVVLDPESSLSALYNISKNRLLTEFNYAAFYYDTSNAVYKDMTWVVNDYIVASTNGSYRLINLTTGAEVLQATERVFIHDDYLVGKESDGMFHVYSTNGNKIGAFQAGSRLYIKSGYMIVIMPTRSTQIYDVNGKQDSQSEVGKEVNHISMSKRIETLDADSSYYKINL